MSATSLMNPTRQTLRAPGQNLHAAKREEAQIMQENRALRKVVFVAVGLLGPLFTVGYAAGRLSAPVPMNRVEIASSAQPQAKPVVANSASPVATAPQSAQQEAGAAQKAKKTAHRKSRRARPQTVANGTPGTNPVEMSGQSTAIPQD